jgi:hypothetical protein
MDPRTRKPRDLAKERFWRRTIAEHARSELFMPAHCQREGLTPSTFRWWCQQLARRDREPPLGGIFQQHSTRVGATLY